MDKPKKFPSVKEINKLLSKMWKSRKNKEEKKMENKRREIAKPAKFSFGKEVNDLLSQIRSIPDGATVKEIFLWELVRNAVPALVDVRMESLIDKKKFGDPPKLFIHIVPDKTNNTLYVIDSGIGMTRDDLVSKLGAIDSEIRLDKYMGTIHKCSTPDYVHLSRFYSKDCLIVGLGFYSAYMVADKVVITTKQKGHEQYVWEFDASANGGSTFTVTAAARDTTSDGGGGDILDWGTKVTVHLKKGHLEYLEKCKLQDLVKKYPKLMCPYPITILDLNENRIEEQIAVEEGEQWKLLKVQYEGVREEFVRYIGEKAKNVDVVISGRVFEASSNLSVDDDKSTFEINPRHPYMEEIRKAVAAKKDLDVKLAVKKDLDVKLVAKKDLDLKLMILHQFESCLSDIKFYDRSLLDQLIFNVWFASSASCDRSGASVA